MRQLIILWYSVLSAAIAARIVFPEVDSFPTACKLQDGTNGTCINLEYCASALTAKDVSTCYMDEPTQYVCCKDDLWNDQQYHQLTIGCGDSDLEIVKGLQTEYEEFPYMAALGFESSLEENSYDYKCGGVIIAPTYVLTAAHCANLNNLAPSVVLVGGINLTDTSATPINISKVIIHPGYKNAESYNDIALLQLESYTMKDTLCVWSLYPLDDLNVTAIGYGHTQFSGVGSDSLLKTYLSIIPNSKCAAFYTNEDGLPNGVVDAQICGKDLERGSDTCQGDSGGPLIFFRKGKKGKITPFLVGITSFGQACALDPPGVYTRVSEYIDWIESVLYAV